MFSSSYYALVAGLREYTLDAETKGFDIKDIIAEADGTVTISREDCVSLFFYNTAEEYFNYYEGDYDISKIDCH